MGRCGPLARVLGEAVQEELLVQQFVGLLGFWPLIRTEVYLPPEAGEVERRPGTGL